MIDAARRAAESGLRTGRLIVAAVVDEEYASIGADALAAAWTADGAVVTEPTDLQIGVGHKGFAWLDVETTGRAAHGTYCTTSGGGGRPSWRADLWTRSTAQHVNSGGHMFEIIRPSAILPQSASDCSPLAAISSGMSARGALHSSLTLLAENTAPW